MKNNPPFSGKLFLSVNRSLGLKYTTPTAYYEKSYKETIRASWAINKEAISIISEHLRDRYLFADLLLYAYYTQMRRESNKAPYSLVVCWHFYITSLLRFTGIRTSSSGSNLLQRWEHSFKCVFQKLWRKFSYTTYSGTIQILLGSQKTRRTIQ